MKFYEAPKGCWVRVIGNVQVPPGSLIPEPGEELKFHYIDGVYTVCTNRQNINVFPAVWTELELLQDQSKEAQQFYWNF